MPLNGAGRHGMLFVYDEGSSFSPALTSRKPGVRSPPEQRSRSTSATDRRSS
jgi:hypothetical protein